MVWVLTLVTKSLVTKIPRIANFYKKILKRVIILKVSRLVPQGIMKLFLKIYIENKKFILTKIRHIRKLHTTQHISAFT